MLFKEWMAKHHPDLNSLEEFERRMMKAAVELDLLPAKGVNSEEKYFAVPVYAKVLGITVEEMMAALQTATIVQSPEPVVPVVMGGGTH